MFSRRNLAFLVAVCSLSANPSQAAGLSLESFKGQSGADYRFYRKNDLAFGWEVKRPDKNDAKIKFCAPSAFTTTTGTVVGIYACKGVLGNAKRISPIGGAILIENGDFNIFPTNKGAVFTKDFLASLEKRKASMFQQYQIVQKRVPAEFKDKKKYQMRSIAKFSDGRTGVIESVGKVGFKQFNSDLVGLGVEDAIYCDMGSWSEGWYRDPKTSALVSIGNDHSNTHKQTNWMTYSEQ